MPSIAAADANGAVAEGFSVNRAAVTVDVLSDQVPSLSVEASDRMQALELRRFIRVLRTGCSESSELLRLGAMRHWPLPVSMQPHWQAAAAVLPESSGLRACQCERRSGWPVTPMYSTRRWPASVVTRHSGCKSDLRNHQAIVQPRLRRSLLKRFQGPHGLPSDRPTDGLGG